MDANLDRLVAEEARAEDIGELVGMRCREQRELYPGVTPYAEFEADFRRFLRASIGRRRRLILVARQDGRIVATAFFSIERQPPQFVDNGCYAYLCNVYTDEKYRRRGILSDLYRTALPLLRERGVCALYCDTRMAGMERFLLQNGWSSRNDYYTLEL